MAQLDPADARLIAEAANRGKISVDNVPEWIMAMRADPASTRATIAKLAPWRPRVSDAASVAYGSVGVEDTLRRMGVNAPLRSVAAAAAPLPAPEVVTGNIGQVLPGAPIRFVTDGRPPEEWTQAERNNETAKQLFPGLAHRFGPTPGKVFEYRPTGRETHLPVQNERGEIEWMPRVDGYKPTVD
jgi:hypothetical protein